eukprot:Hpha_TRINITY_DN15693_c1_g3::TRINITY_DN15693_c1_g3_i2::g.99347::m.99347
MMTGQQQRLETRSKELESELRTAERTLAERIEQVNTHHNEQSVAVTEQVNEARSEARRTATEIGTEVRALQEQAHRRTREAEEVAKAAAQELRQRLLLVQQELTTQMQALGRASEERDEATRVREEELGRRSREATNALDKRATVTEAKLEEALRKSQVQDKWVAEAEKREQDLQKSQQAWQRTLQSDLTDTKDALLLLTRQTGDDQQSTNASIEILQELLNALSETVREDLTAELADRLDEVEQRVANTARSKQQSEASVRQQMDELQSAARSAQQRDTLRIEERLEQLQQRSTMLEGRQDTSLMQLEQAIEARISQVDMRWEEKRIQEGDKIASIERNLSGQQMDLRDLQSRLQQANSAADQRYEGARKAESTRVSALEQWKDATEARLRKQDDALELRKKEQSRDASEAVSLDGKIRNQEDSIESLRRVVNRFSDDREQQVREQEQLKTRMKACEDQETVRKQGDAEWDQWMKTVNRRLAAIGEAGPQEGPTDAAVLDAVREVELVLEERTGPRSVEDTESENRLSLVLMEEALREAMCSIMIIVDNHTAFTNDLVQGLGQQIDDFFRAEEEEEERRLRDRSAAASAEPQEEA